MLPCKYGTLPVQVTNLKWDHNLYVVPYVVSKGGVVGHDTNFMVGHDICCSAYALSCLLKDRLHPLPVQT